MLLPSSPGFSLSQLSQISADLVRYWQRALATSTLTLGVLLSSTGGSAIGSASVAPLLDQTAQFAAQITHSTARPKAQSKPVTRSKMSFDQLMNVGYAASRQGDFNTALINFRRALALRPSNSYAAAAADNMIYYIEHARVTARQWEITQLETRLTNAINQKDWVCAATTLDELTMYTKPDSLNRARLVGQRGEVTGRLDARLDHEAWSTVCVAERPVY
jgi:tetratricopeptide (TPR) repeat protein